jgi:tetratricopeptide (TPR) repeat protein
MPLNTFTIFSLSILHTTILSIHGFLVIRPSPNHVILSMVGNDDTLQWDIYVDQSKAAIARGSTATLDAFQTLSPSSYVQVHPCILNSGNRVKSPTVRCRSRFNPEYCLEIANVDSVEKVYRILSRHLQVQDLRVNACYCIKWKHKGNAHLEKEETDLAIEAYDNALATNYAEHEGTLLMMRASAYLQRAAKLKLELKNLVLEHTKQVPDTNNLIALYAEAGQVPTLAPSIFQRIESYTRMQETTFRGIKYCHGLYQYAVLHAVQDALRATQLEPQSQQSWLLAADGLSELWKLSDSIQYYKMAAEMDPNLEHKVQFEISRLENRQDLLDNANAYGWSEDILRLALDVGQVD